MWQTASPKNSAEKEGKRLLSSFDYNHDLLVLLFCIKLNFMITLIALFMSRTCYYVRCFSSIHSAGNAIKKAKALISYKVKLRDVVKYLEKICNDER